MRVAAFLVVACGCRVAASAGVDATTPRGDGLPERVITDAALWADQAAPERASDGAGVEHAREDVGADSEASERPPDLASPGSECSLLGVACVGREGCYPFPFEGAPNGDTRCAFQGVGGPSVPCQSQLECDGTTLCSAPGEPDSLCLQRCDLGNGRCPTGFRCTPYAGYPGVGVCVL